ncbi:sulfur relay protein, TusE/DsrC/DsvC family [Thiorhodovibrio winogradskyi]|uniref:Sulfur relay protein, TusE/DsrC/DsvC family n=1 Tax=Thiorhodovibrio winogradskyi TaxID=77007 RepID=A0ABZ0SCX9_9GAMM|nr:TusE/DsrC/DsvC family sulfur relay protein [Thiorhodovibrio winogradskyi]
MTDIKQVINNPDTSSPLQADREYDLAEWSREWAQEKADELGMRLTDDHWSVIDALRAHYRELPGAA